MKNLIITTIIALLVASWSIAGAQDYPDEYLGLPGDNLNLYAVMKLFQESETLEDFEKSLNDENTLVNNLDLNGDNMVDYIMVYDYVDGNVHNIVLRVAIDQRETQDVAVFTVQQFNDGSVQVQLVGDELLYGKNYIVEPYYAENGSTPNPGYVGNTRGNKKVTIIHTSTYHVAEWPIVRFIFLPSYVVWRSSWYWGYRPVYWNPWRPFYWHTYYGYHSHYHHHYHAHYRHCNHYRYPRHKNHYYTNIRTYSPRITVNINKGVYRTTYSRPDLREQGEVLYARKNSGRNSATLRKSASIGTRASSTAVRRSRTNTQNSVGNRSAVRSSAVRENNATVTHRNSAERKSATVRRSRNSTNSAVRQKSGATRSISVNPSRGTTVTRSARTNSGATVGLETSRVGRPSAGSSNRSIKSSNARDNKSAVRNSPVNASQRSSVSRAARSSAPQKSAKVSTSRNTSRSVIRPSSSSSKRTAPAVSRQSAPGTKSATRISSSKNSSRSSAPPVISRSSSSESRGAATRSRGPRSSSSRASGRR